MGEKSELWSTDRIMVVANPPGVQNPDKVEFLKAFFEESRAQWNPVLAIAVPSPSVFKARVSIVAAIRARGVRFNKRWLSEFSDNNRQRLPDVNGGVAMYIQMGDQHAADSVVRVTELGSNDFIQIWN